MLAALEGLGNITSTATQMQGVQKVAHISHGGGIQGVIGGLLIDFCYSNHFYFLFSL
jgi:hypothetical protein